MSSKQRPAESLEPLPDGLDRVPARPLVVLSPSVRLGLLPGDHVLVVPGESVSPGTPLAERTPDASLVEVGALVRPNDARVAGLQGGPESSPEDAEEHGAPEPGAPEPGAESGADEAPPGAGSERRRRPLPGKWWVGGAERRGHNKQRGQSHRIAGTLLYDLNGRWRAAAGERHEIVESTITGVVTEARNGVGITIKVSGAAIPAAIAEGTATRGYMDVPPLVDGELAGRALDVGRSGAIVVAGTRVSAEALMRARAMSIRGVVAGSVGQAELRELAASEARQRAGLGQAASFAVVALEGYMRRPIASPVLTLMAALSGRDVAISIDPPMLIFDTSGVTLPQLPFDWVRVRSGPLAGREGRWLGAAGLHRFRSGVHLESGLVRLGADLEPSVVALNDLERFIAHS